MKQSENLTNKQNFKNIDFDAIRLSVASPEKVDEWSNGEVLKPETINYRTQKPERDGLFCERIFGPIKDWECYCGKYKKIRYKGVVCDKCGVEVTRSSVRREKMGHIDLVTPVAHVWYVHGTSSILGTVMNMTVNDLEKIIYFAGFIVLEVDEQIKSEAIDQLEEEYKNLKKKADKNEITKIDTIYKKTKQELNSLAYKKIFTESEYHELSLKYGQIVRVGIGAEAIYEILKRMNLEEEIKQIKNEIAKGNTSNLKKLFKRYRLLVNMQQAGVKPEWLIMTKLPVIPPDLRPMVHLDGGRFATSDLNDLYRRVINRNNRLKKLVSQGAPEVICRNEKRMLQEAIDSLIDNSARRGKAVAQTSNQRKLKSLSDMLKGKQGRFRQNLLGKRVDYSGRSVIVVGPNLKLNECGIPKDMALELFKPYVISQLISEGYIHNVKNASKLIDQGVPEVWDMLEKVIKGTYVLLNRAPTLHRLGIQAFQPVLVEGKAIQIHPLVCQAFNADFDGDQMAVHIPLSKQAQWEAKNIMQSSNNLLKPSSGEPIVSPRLDMVLGCYYMTAFLENAKGEGKIFSSKNEAIMAYQSNYLHIRARIKVRMNIGGKKEEIVETSIGRILFNNILPKELRYLNQIVDAKALKQVVSECFDKMGTQETAKLVDRIKDLGFKYAGDSGITISIDDITISDKKNEIVAATDKIVEQVKSQYEQGLISEEEKSVKIAELWFEAKDKVEKQMLKDFNKLSPVYTILVSGARGSVGQLIQLAGMKGSVVNPSGEIIEIPVKSNFKEGLSITEYFISTHGARKGRADTALRTSDSGYLTRRLVDVSQDLIVVNEDCHTEEGIEVIRSDDNPDKYYSRIFGRFTLQDVIDPKTKKIIIKKNTEIDENVIKDIKKHNISSIYVRSVMTCKNDFGICQKCYGKDLSTGKIAEIGSVIGVMAAQAIGEPGTQLTLRTFHMGGVSGADITSGLPRVEELFEARVPKMPAIISKFDGTIKIEDEKNIRKLQLVSVEVQREEHAVAKDYIVTVKNNEFVKAKQAIMTSESKKAIRAKISGIATVAKDKITIESKENIVETFQVSPKLNLYVKNNEQIKKGQIITEGHLNLENALEIKGKTFVQEYIIDSIKEIYESQGQSINEKHVEIILKQMFSKVHIHDSGDSDYITGQIVERSQIEKTNNKLVLEKKKPAIYKDVILGITRVSLKTDSFLSAASFQETTSTLINAAISGSVDHLKGLKENVIIGKLIPAGTGLDDKIINN
jgi:DNA-directed RNA polymerase subunit beta'